jgi:hypothetical protein
MALVGNRLPRIYTPELRPLTPETSAGFTVLDWMERNLNFRALPWQAELVIRSHELKPTDGSLRFRRIAVIAGRRSGKSSLIAALSAYWLAHGWDCLYTSSTIPAAREIYLAVGELTKAEPDIFGAVRQRGTHGQYEVSVPKLRRRFFVAAMNGTASRGRGAGRALLDELRELKDESAIAAIVPTALAVPGSQVWMLSSAGDRTAAPLLKLREQGRASAACGPDPDEITGYFEYSADDDLDMMDPLAWQQGIPALGHGTIDEQGVRLMIDSMSPAAFRSEILSQFVDALEGILQPAQWDACFDPMPIRSSVALGFEISADLRHATLVAAEPLPDGRVRLEVVTQWRAPDDGEAGLSVPLQVRAELPTWVERIHPTGVGLFPNSSVQPLMLDLRESIGSSLVELTGTAVGEAHSSLVESITSGTVRHAGDELLSAHILGLTKRPAGEAFRLAGGNGVDAAFAASAALYLARRQTEEPGDLELRWVSPDAKPIYPLTIGVGQWG